MSFAVSVIVAGLSSEWKQSTLILDILRTGRAYPFAVLVFVDVLLFRMESMRDVIDTSTRGRVSDFIGDSTSFRCVCLYGCVVIPNGKHLRCHTHKYII